MADFTHEHPKIETTFKTYFRLLCFYAERIVGNKDAAEDGAGLLSHVQFYEYGEWWNYVACYSV